MKARAVLVALLLLFVPNTIGAQEMVTVRTDGPPNEGYKLVYYAVAAGLFHKYGLNVEPTIVNSGNAAMAALAGGAVEVAWTNLFPVIQAHLRGVPFVVVAPSTLYNSDRPQIGMLVLKDSPIRNARDLTGKTIASQSLQDLNSIAMLAWIDKNGGDPHSVRMIEVPASATVAALEEHRVDAITLPEPSLSQAVASGKVRILARPHDAIARHFQTSAYVATSDYVMKNQDVMLRFARAMHESVVYNNSHQADTIDLVSSFTRVAPDVIAHSVRAFDAEYVDPKNIQPLIDAAAKYGLISKTFPAQEIVSSTALKAPR